MEGQPAEADERKAQEEVQQEAGATCFITTK